VGRHTPAFRQEDTAGIKSNCLHGSVSLSATKVVPQTGEIAEEVLQSLAAQYGVEVEVILDIRAELPSGF